MLLKKIIQKAELEVLNQWRHIISFIYASKHVHSAISIAASEEGESLPRASQFSVFLWEPWANLGRCSLYDYVECNILSCCKNQKHDGGMGEYSKRKLGGFKPFMVNFEYALPYNNALGWLSGRTSSCDFVEFPLLREQAVYPICHKAKTTATRLESSYILATEQTNCRHYMPKSLSTIT